MQHYRYDVSVIILNYRAKDYLRKAIFALLNSKTQYSFEIIVVDNDSGDGSAEMIEREFGSQVLLLKEPNNGFSAGNNAGIRASSGEMLLILNPDTEVAQDCLEKTISFLKNRPQAGIVTAKLLLDNGEVDPACRRNFPNPINSFFYLFSFAKLLPKNKLTHGYQRGGQSDLVTQQIDSANGAYMLVSRACFEKIGPLDERYFMWGEDIDWCLQAKREGFEVWYLADATCLHHKGQPHKRSAKMLWVFYDSMFKYYRKNLAPNYPWILNKIVYLGIWVRYGIAYGINSLKK